MQSKLLNLLNTLTQFCNMGLSHCIILTSCISLYGCALSPISSPNINKFQITNSTFDTPQCTSSNQSNLQIIPARANKPYDTTKMFYSKTAYALDNYVYNQWVTLPQTMLSQRIEQSLSQACIYANVVSNPFLITANYSLSTQLIELKQVIKHNSTTVVLIIQEQLINNTSSQIIKSKTFIETTEVANTAEGFVIGANQNTQRFLDKLILWLK